MDNQQLYQDRKIYKFLIDIELVRKMYIPKKKE